MKTDYHFLIGLTKEQVLHNLGDEFNIPYSNVWNYLITKNIFLKKELHLFFDKENKVKKYVIKTICRWK